MIWLFYFYLNIKKHKKMEYFKKTNSNNPEDVLVFAALSIMLIGAILSIFSTALNIFF